LSTPKADGQMIYGNWQLYPPLNLLIKNISQWFCKTPGFISTRLAPAR
jgi:hypothetical protein